MRSWRKWALGLGVAVMIASPAAAGGAAMTFRIAPLQGAHCGGRCPSIVVADGVIESDTAERFVDFARNAARRAPHLKTLMLINSPGGSVMASMDLGRGLRALGMSAVVAGYGEDGRAAGPIPGQCISACVYALMGAIKRVAPAESWVALHRMSFSETVMPLRGQIGSLKRGLADRELVDVVARYARKMGVSPEVVRAAESLDPDSVRRLTTLEMKRWRLASPKL